MADNKSPPPFRRERNLSNRNFNKRDSRRRVNADSRSSSTDSFSNTTSESNASSTAATSNSSSGSCDLTAGSSSLQISYSVNSDTENAFNQKSLLKMMPPSGLEGNGDVPPSPDPALMDVKQKVLRFETLRAEERIIFKTGKYWSRTQQGTSMTPRQMGPLRVLPVFHRKNTEDDEASVRSPSISHSFQTSIDEERSEDDVDEFSDYAEDERDPSTGNSASKSSEAEYILPEGVTELKENVTPSPLSGAYDHTDEVFIGIGSNPTIQVAPSSPTTTSAINSNHSNEPDQLEVPGKMAPKPFSRNYRSRPKTEVIGTKNNELIGKYSSLYEPKNDEQEEEAELRNKSDKLIQPILEELIKTEETYVENLLKGITNYGNIFQRKDLPLGLRGKKFVLLGNIEQIAEFHRDEFLPMLHRNRRHLQQLFEEFQNFIDENCFYGYVIFTMNKQRSLKLCDAYKNYFKLIQSELDDKLGINSFLVQPIQRMARYPLLLQQFITTLFKNRDYVMKPVIESCCRLEKRMRTLLTVTNESEIINDIIDCNEFNVFYQGRFRKVNEFHVFDHTLKRTYRSKVFIFDKCIIYTEIKGKSLIFHGRYPCEHIGIVAKAKCFTLFYQRRKQQECDFHAEATQVEAWLELIRDMLNNFAAEERQKLQERYSRENDHLHHKALSLSLFRDSNRFSSDSGIGNIWVMPKPEIDSIEATGNRTTWYGMP